MYGKLIMVQVELDRQLTNLIHNERRGIQDSDQQYFDAAKQQRSQLSDSAGRLDNLQKQLNELNDLKEMFRLPKLQTKIVSCSMKPSDFELLQPVAYGHITGWYFFS